MENRTILVLVIAVVFVAALWWTSRAPGTLISEEVVQAIVIKVELRQRGPDKVTHVPLLVTVELPEGGQGKLWMPPPGPAVKQSIPVRVRRYDNGLRRLSAGR